MCNINQIIIAHYYALLHIIVQFLHINDMERKMLSFRPGQKLENEFRILQGTLVESYTNIETYHLKKLNLSIVLL